MLQMMTNEFIKNVEKNTNEMHNDNEQMLKSINANNDNNRMNSINNSEKALYGLSVNNKQQMFDDSLINQRKSGKIRLPIMGKYIKSKKNRNSSDIPVSDEEREKEREKEYLEKFKINGSPKIVKITKKKNPFPNMFIPNEIYDNNINTESNINRNTIDFKQNVAKSINFKS